MIFRQREIKEKLRKISCEFIFHKIDSHGWHLANSFELNWGIQTQMPAVFYLNQAMWLKHKKEKLPQLTFS